MACRVSGLLHISYRVATLTDIVGLASINDQIRSVSELDMIRVYEQCDFLDLSQVLDYLKRLSGLEIEKSMLIQLINDKKIPCYVDADGLSGVLQLTHLDPEDLFYPLGTVAIGLGKSLILSPFIVFDCHTNSYGSKGYVKGFVKIRDRRSKPTEMVWQLDETPYDQRLEPLENKSYLGFVFNDYYVKPADVKKFAISINSDSSKTTIREDANESALLMIAYLRDLVCDPADGRDNAAKRVPTQNKLALELYEKYGLSTSSSEKLFAAAKIAAKEAVKEKK